MNSYPRKNVRIIWTQAALVITGAALAITQTGCAPATTASGGSSTPASAGSGPSGGTSSSASEEIDACSLLGASDASTPGGETLSAGVWTTLTAGEDECDVETASHDVIAVQYQSASGRLTLAKALVSALK